MCYHVMGRDSHTRSCWSFLPLRSASLVLGDGVFRHDKHRGRKWGSGWQGATQAGPTLSSVSADDWSVTSRACVQSRGRDPPARLWV